jgi:anion-transporting  ArsA/GET3 family ATPase
MEEGFRQRALRVNALLAAPETAFILVASPRRDTLDEAHFFAARLAAAGIGVDGLVVNRVHARFGAGLAEAARARADTLEGTGLGALYANLADFQSIATRERDHFAGLADTVAPAPVIWVPFLRRDVHDLDGMEEVARYLYRSPVRPELDPPG